MLYIFHGPDNFSQNEKIAQLRVAMGDPALADINITVLEGRETSLSEIRHHADAMPFMADKRLVVVKSYLSQLKKDSDALTQLVEYLGQISPTTDLVFAEPDLLDSRHPILKAVPKAQINQFSGPDKKNLRDWIINRSKQHDADIEPVAADLLGKLVGPDLRTLDNELEKLALYVGAQATINQASVELLVPYTEDSEDFGLANAIGQRNAARAYDQMHKMLEEDKHPMAILGSIATQMRGLLEVKDMAEQGMSPQEIAQKKGWRSDYAAKMRLREATKFSTTRLEEVLEMLLEIDLQIKTGRIDGLLALDSLIARLCAIS
jgi:DNA polymerase-3 subunit delta